jgi:ketosteroid isomerase-like protein
VADVEEWVRRYAEAWDTNDPQRIAELFTPDASYYTAPFREPWRGRDGIVEGWLARKDDSGTWRFRHEVMAVAGDQSFVRGWTEYLSPPQRYSNLWIIRLEQDGRCSEFTEWWMLESEGVQPNP